MSKARLVITALFVDHQAPAEVAARYGVTAPGSTSGRPATRLARWRVTCMVDRSHLHRHRSW